MGRRAALNSKEEKNFKGCMLCYLEWSPSIPLGSSFWEGTVDKGNSQPKGMETRHFLTLFNQYLKAPFILPSDVAFLLRGIFPLLIYSMILYYFSLNPE